MNVLVLLPSRQRLSFCYFANGWQQPICAGQYDDYRDADGSRLALTELTRSLAEAGRAQNAPARPDVIALRGISGGADFKKPALVSPGVLRKLEKRVPFAPLHIPALVALIHAAQATFRGVPIVLVFETGFFVDLPEREHLYAVDANLTQTVGVRRFGYHGILHAAACNHIARQRRAMGVHSPARVISICLEPRPELAAVLGHKPLMVTSGATPLEGLPGQTTSGELDPSIVLMLAQRMGWGPEQINAVLTQQSGWLGLVGRMTTLPEIFASHRPECELARKIIQYRLLQACGAGIAALSGLDALVFSGRYSGVGVSLGPWLKKRLASYRPDSSITVTLCQEPVERVLAETVCAAALKLKPS